MTSFLKRLSLQSLPTEVLLIILEYCRPTALVALKLTCRRFFADIPFTPISISGLSRCEENAFKDYLEPCLNISDPERLQRCLICKNLYPSDLFTSSKSPLCSSRPPSGAHCEWSRLLPARARNSKGEVLEIPEQICSWHIGRFYRFVKITAKSDEDHWLAKPLLRKHRAPRNYSPLQTSKPSWGYDYTVDTRRMQNAKTWHQPGWFSIKRPFCTHCGVVDWSYQSPPVSTLVPHGDMIHSQSPSSTFISDNSIVDTLTLGFSTSLLRWACSNDLAMPSERNMHASCLLNRNVAVEVETPKCDCHEPCHICPKLMVRTYTRYVVESEDEGSRRRRTLFWRDSDGALMVRETLWGEDPNEVRLEDWAVLELG
jgi:hypothetical protein